MHDRKVHWGALDKRMVSEPAKAFIRRLTEPDPTKRMSVEDALADPWLDSTPLSATSDADGAEDRGEDGEGCGSSSSSAGVTMPGGWHPSYESDANELSCSVASLALGRPVAAKPKLRREVRDQGAYDTTAPNSSKVEWKRRAVEIIDPRTPKTPRTKRKARDPGSDHKLSPTAPAGEGSKKARAAVDGKELGRSSAPRRTSSSNLTVGGGDRSKKGGSTEGLPDAVEATARVKAQKPTGGAVATTPTRASARPRHSLLGQLSPGMQRTPEKRARLSRYRAPSGLSDEDEDDDDEQAPATRAKAAGPRKSAPVFASPPSPLTSAAVKRGRRSGLLVRPPKLR